MGMKQKKIEKINKNGRLKKTEIFNSPNSQFIFRENFSDWSFDDYSGFQPKTTPAQRYAKQCKLMHGLEDCPLSTFICSRPKTFGHASKFVNMCLICTYFSILFN